jgi:CBS domain-containing protein
MDTPDLPLALTAGDLMQPVITTVEPAAHLAAAAYLMRQARSSVLVVLKDALTRTPIGIVTDADVAHAVADGRSIEDTRVRDVLHGPPISVRPEVSIDEATERMLAAGVRHLPVVDERGLAGMLDLSMACRVLLDRSATRTGG